MASTRTTRSTRICNVIARPRLGIIAPAVDPLGPESWPANANYSGAAVLSSPNGTTRWTSSGDVHTFDSSSSSSFGLNGGGNCPWVGTDGTQVWRMSGRQQNYTGNNGGLYALWDGIEPSSAQWILIDPTAVNPDGTFEIETTPRVGSTKCYFYAYGGRSVDIDLVSLRQVV